MKSPVSRSRSARRLLTAATLLIAGLATANAHASGGVTADPVSILWTAPTAKAKAVLLPIARSGGANAAEAQRALAIISSAEDDDSAAADRWLSLFTQAKDPEMEEIYWLLFWNSDNSRGQRSKAAIAARALLAAKSTTPYLRESAQDILGLALDEANRPSEADAAWKSLGYIRQWQVIGPFDNAALAGFDKASGPEREIAFTNSYPGRNGLMLHWYPEKLVDRDASVHVGTTLGSDAASCFYAVTAVQSPADGTQAAISYTVSGASKVYLNGALVSKDTIYRSESEHGPAPWRVPVTLHRGWNTILIKIADDENHTAEFRLRVTDPSGNLPMHLVADPVHAEHGSVTETAGVSAPASVVLDRLNARIAKNPDDIEARYCLGIQLRELDDYEGSEAALRAALERAPQSALLHWELSQTLTEDEQKDAGIAERDKALALDDRLIAAQLSRLDEQDKSLKPAERIAVLRGLLARVNPNSSSLLFALASADIDAELKDDALGVIKQALAVAPSLTNYHWAVTTYSKLSKPTLAMNTLQEAVKRFPEGSDVLTAEAMLQSSTGNTAGAASLLNRALLCNEEPTPARLELASLYTDQHKLALAVSQLTLAHQEEPQDSDICAQLADARTALGDRAGAIALYREAVRLNPAHVALREKLQSLNGEKAVVDLAPATDTASIIANLGKTKAPAGASEVRVLDEGRVVVYPDYARVLYMHEILTVLDAAAVQKYQYYRFPLPSGSATATVETARIIKANHEIVDCKDNAESSYAAFPSLSAGDSIELSVRVEDYPTGGLAGTFCDEWYFPKADGPLGLSRYVVISPKNMALTFRSHGGIGDGETREKGTWNIHEWHTSDMSTASVDPLALPLKDYGPWVDVSSIASWQRIVDWYQTISSPQCIPDATVSAKALELTKDCKTDSEKIRAIVEYVAAKIQYQSSPFRMSAFIPTTGKKVLRESYGDCKDKAALVTAMLSKVGIKSHMALISPRNYGTTPYLPGPRFAHAIAVVDTTAGPLWVDATASTMGFGELPSSDQDVPALIIRDGVTDLENTPTSVADHTTMTETYETSLDTHGALSGSFDLAASGNDAWYLRSVFSQLPENQRATTVNQVFSSLLAGAKIADSTVNGITDVDAPMDFHCTYQTADFAQAADNLLLTKLPWALRWTAESGMLTALHSAPLRKDDIDTSVIHGKRIARLVLNLPAGYTVKSPMPEAKGDSPFGSYKFTYHVEGNKLIAERDVVITSMRIPASDASRFVDFEDAIDKQMKTPVILQKL